MSKNTLISCVPVIIKEEIDIEDSDLVVSSDPNESLHSFGNDFDFC